MLRKWSLSFWEGGMMPLNSNFIAKLAFLKRPCIWRIHNWQICQLSKVSNWIMRCVFLESFRHLIHGMCSCLAFMINVLDALRQMLWFVVANNSNFYSSKRTKKALTSYQSATLFVSIIRAMSTMFSCPNKFHEDHWLKNNWMHLLRRWGPIL